MPAVTTGLTQGETMDEKHKTEAPTTDTPATDASVEEEHVEDLEAPAGRQERVVGGNCGANTYIVYTLHDTL